MATRGGWISLPLAVGVDRGHPQAAGSGSQPPPVAGSIYLFFFFWFASSPKRQIGPLRVAGSLPLAVGVDRGHPQWPDLFSSFFFSLEKSPEKAVGGGICSPEWAVGGGEWRSLGWLVD
jgi:hypothetical protein